LLDRAPAGRALGRSPAENGRPGIPPPVPAALRIDPRDRLRLREEDDEPVLVGDLGVAGLLDEGVAHRLPRLLAAMERDMDPAACLLGAARRDIDAPLVGEAVAGLEKR